MATTAVSGRETSGARQPAINHDVAATLAATEYDRFLETLRGLGRDDWSRSTDCPGWDVHDVTGHVLGMAELAASLLEQRRQMRAAARAGGSGIDALTAVQVAKHHDDLPDTLVERFADVSPRAARSRRRTPSFIRRRPMSAPQQVGKSEEIWTIGYLLDVILTRDTWMHRIDVCRAVGAEPRLTAAHDAVLVADIVAEWAARLGSPHALTLTGPAGGTWSTGTGGPELRMDAVKFCRRLSGRGGVGGVEGILVPF